MKPFLFILFLPTLSFAQLTGIGIFKIGNTKKFILGEVKKATGKELILYNGIMAKYKATALKADRTEYVSGLVGERLFPNEEPTTKQDPNRQDIDINYYSISGIPLRGIQLVFSRDTLILFACRTSDSLYQALITKYGEPKSRLEKNAIKCRSKLAGSFDLEEVVNHFIWDNEDININNEYAEGYKYDDKCKKEEVSRFEVKDKKRWLSSLMITFPNTKIDSSALKDF